MKTITFYEQCKPDFLEKPCNSKVFLQDFPRGSVTKALNFHSRECGFNPWLRY